MFPIVSGVAMGQGPAALAATLDETNQPPQIILVQQGLPSNAGEIGYSITASGGSGSYSYAWSTSIVDSGMGMLSINSQGTTNGTTYSDATVVGGANQGVSGYDSSYLCR